MSDKKQLIVNGVNVSKCSHLYVHPESGAIWCTHRRFGCCQVMPNCRFKEVARLKHELKAERIRNTLLKKRIAKELIKLDRYLERIKGIIKEYDCVNCREQHCEDCNKGEIFYIINEAKGGMKDSTINEVNNASK